MMSRSGLPFLAAAEGRGFVHQITDRAALEARLAAGPTVAYVGFDCTADSLHIGNLVGIMLLRLFQQSGHKPIVLMGGGTTKVGDPSGKDESRKLLTDADVAANMASIRSTSIISSPSATAHPTPSWSTTPTGSIGWPMFPSYERSDGISRSIAC